MPRDRDLTPKGFHVMNRTSPKGQDFWGECQFCQAEGDVDMVFEFCNSAPLEQEDRLIAAIVDAAEVSDAN